MRLDSIVFGIAGACFGIIVGWVLGSQVALQSPAGRAAAGSAAPAPQAESAPALIDDQRVQSLRTVADRDPENVEVRVQLGNLYYDAGRYDLAIPWYEGALALDPEDPNVSTDLGVAYYQTSQPDRALRQFDHSLEVEPGHVKTLLNVGVVRAFGKQDLEGAIQAWQQVVDVAPGTQEADIARRALDSLAAGHADLVGGGSASGSAR